MSNFSYILETYPEMNKAYFHEMAEIFNQLNNKDQVELFKYFHNNYTTKKLHEWNIDGITHILDKLPFEYQMEIVIFFQELYDPETMVK